MVNITVGQTLNIGIAVWDFCGYTNYIYIGNMGLGVNTPPSVTIKPASCQNISNIGIEFKLAIASGSTACNKCLPDVTYATLGTIYTNSQGIASISHVISNNDLSYYQQAVAAGGSLKILACIINSQGQDVVSPGHCSEPIIIAGAVIPEPTHEIKFQLADNPFISYIQSGIVEISVRLVSALKFDNIPVQYIRSEMDTTNKVFKVFVKYTGIETVSVSGLSPETTKLMDDIQSMAIIDSIKAFAERALIIITTIVVAYLVASIILSGGWTIVTVAQAALVGTAIFILGYAVYSLVDNLQKAEETIKIYQAKDSAGTTRDTTKGQLDDTFDKTPYSKDSCVTLLTGYQAADVKYLDTLTKELTQMKLNEIKNVYLDCTNTIINTFKTSSGAVADCNTARAGFTPCVNAMATATNTEFSTKYTDPNAHKEKGCGPDCSVCEPFTETCLVPKGQGLTFLLAGLVGIALLGIFMSSRGRSTVVVKAEK